MNQFTELSCADLKYNKFIASYPAALISILLVLTKYLEQFIGLNIFQLYTLNVFLIWNYI
jgi:hypothetical protein